MARQSNADYWAQRLKNMEDALLDRSYSYVENLNKQFAAADAELRQQMESWYQRLASNNEITLADAKKLLTADELDEFHWTVEQYIKYGEENALDQKWIKQLENASAKVHISRLEALQTQLRQQAEKLHAEVEKAAESAARGIYEGSYYRTAYEVQKGLGVGWGVAQISEGVIEKVLSRPWTADMQTFRDHCWTNKSNLIDSVNKNLTQMIIRGEAPDRAIAAIAKQFEVSKSKAGRLVMTESAYFSSAGQKDCYEALDVERYEVIASRDRDTCSLCGAMDGKVFKLSEYQPGLTANPFHPWCRCCTAPYDEDVAKLLEERNAGENPLPGDMSYKQWKAWQDEIHGAGTVDYQRKLSYNETADKAQFKRYKAMFGADFPKSLDAFQRMKYNDPERWEHFKAIARSKNYLQQQLGYVWNGEKLFIPQYAKFEKVTTMAGAGAKKPIKDINRLLNSYGSTSDKWKKQAGKVSSDRYTFDVHWYECDDGIQHDVKLKNRTEKKK